MGELWLADASGATYPSWRAIGNASTLTGFLEQQPVMTVAFYAPADIDPSNLFLCVNTADGPVSIPLLEVEQSK